MFIFRFMPVGIMYLYSDVHIRITFTVEFFPVKQANHQKTAV